MSLAEASASGASMATSVPSGSRKEKKKQAKEERDRLKQVEKKKRRLGKALATAAAIRLELEKKKQKRKEEEEQRLDEEGAALAESVALQVLVGDNGDTYGGPDAQVIKNPDSLQDLNGSEKKDCENACNYEVANVVSTSTHKEMLLSSDTSSSCLHRHLEGDQLKDFQGLQFCNIAMWEHRTTRIGDDVKGNIERAKAAEFAAGMAATQAVAALRIAEEARAEAEAAKRVAEAAINHVLDNAFLHQASFHPRNLEKERDELRARLEETERQLKEKTQQVVHLEQNLEHMTHYLLDLKERMPFLNVERQAESSKRGSTNLTESSVGTVDQ